MKLHPMDMMPERKRPSACTRSLLALLAITVFSCWIYAIAAYVYPLAELDVYDSDHSKHASSAHAATASPMSPLSDLTILRSPCGNSAVEARAVGCIFDPNSFVWNHPRCSNPELTAEFLAIKNWTWYTDHSLSHKLTFEDVMTGTYNNTLVQEEFHVQHCLMMWRMLHAQALGPYGRFGVDSYLGNMMHTRHCGAMLVSGVAFSEWQTIIRLKFPDCGMDVLSMEQVMAKHEDEHKLLDEVEEEEEPHGHHH